MKFHKRQLILASLVVALGAAVYLNWQFSDDHGLEATSMIESEREFGEAKYVNSSAVESDDSNKSESSQSKAFFAQAFSNRQKSRDESLEKIKNLMSSADKNPDVKSDILKQSEELTKNIQQESNIENLIKAKGFTECMVFIQNGECSVIVSRGELNENSAIIIKDIVAGQANIKYDKIKITESK